MPGATDASRRRWLAAAAIGLSLVAATFAAIGYVTWVAIAAWAVGLVLFPRGFAGRDAGNRTPPRDRLLAVAMGLLPVLVRVVCTTTQRFYGDELLIGFFSATEKIAPARFFGPVPQDPTEWVSQFPATFFVLEQAVLDLLGRTIPVLRLSVLPYVFLSGAFLFLTVREVIDRTAGVLAVAFWSFLAISLYLETTALSNISAVGLFLPFLWSALRADRGSVPRDAVLTGMLAAGCYLFYPGSFVALPILLVITLLRMLRRRRLELLQNVVRPGLGFLVVFAPFVPYLVKVENYLIAYPGRVALFGPDSDASRRIQEGESAIRIVLHALSMNLRALVESHVGGAGGYWFGGFALFDRLTLVLFVAGLVAAPFVFQKRRQGWFLLLVILAVWLMGAVLIAPPPAFHRLGIACACAGAVLAFPVWLLLRVPRVSRGVAAAAAGAILLTFAATNLEIFERAALLDDDFGEALRLCGALVRRYPDRMFYVAAEPVSAFAKIGYWADDRWRRMPRTDYHDPLLREMNTDEKYVYVVAYPDNFRERFLRRDPNGRFRKVSANYGVFLN